MKKTGTTGFSSRDFIRAAAVGAGLVGWRGGDALLGGSRQAERPRKKIPVGVQLYSVRAAAPKDLPGTLKQIKEMGYEGVDFAGYYSKSAKDLRQLLDDHTTTGSTTLSR